MLITSFSEFHATQKSRKFGLFLASHREKSDTCIQSYEGACDTEYTCRIRFSCIGGLGAAQREQFGSVDGWCRENPGGALVCLCAGQRGARNQHSITRPDQPPTSGTARHLMQTYQGEWIRQQPAIAQLAGWFTCKIYRSAVA